ncbi:heparan-alpha-glucosaminide N-acetyltransferase [Euwallacea fornicatus]|uniref:heparan-alpha-glucosaminide N-acetyltransferase n=1 Tax=Euwallacea fornicatus TaxID=995702 RepID=UPI00338E8F3A
MTWNFIDKYSGNRMVTIKNKTFDMDQLKIDQNFVTVSATNLDLHDIHLYTLHNDCIECPYRFMDKSRVNITETDLKFRLASDLREYYPQEDQDSVICDINPHFEQFGIYDIKVETLTSCSIEVLKQPVNADSPIVTVLILHILVFGGVYLLLNLWQKWRKGSAVNSQVEATGTTSKVRVMSIDVFRGISIVIMIFANFGNGGYKYIEHATWNGLHVADLVFPWFMWIMGTCIPISLLSSFNRGVSNKDLMRNVAKRSVKLFLLGIFLNSGTDLYYLRIFGVLQRFGLCYFIVTTICIFTMERDLGVKQVHSVLRQLADVWKVWKAWLICLAVLMFHTIVIFTVAEEGCPRGYMGPGGLHKNQSYKKCVGGATGYIDRLILGHHVYQYPTIYEIFEAKQFDPEGIVGCLTTIFHVMLGVQAGVILLVYKEHHQRIVRWLIWSVVLGGLGGALCGFSKEDGFIPVNKNLWSISFVLVTCSFAFFLLSVCYFLVDVKKWWSGKPLLFAGMNSIILYIGHEMTGNNFPVRWYYLEDMEGDWRTTHFIALLSDTWAADFWVIVSYYLYKIQYFFTV